MRTTCAARSGSSSRRCAPSRKHAPPERPPERPARAEGADEAGSGLLDQLLLRLDREHGFRLQRLEDFHRAELAPDRAGALAGLVDRARKAAGLLAERSSTSSILTISALRGAEQAARSGRPSAPAPASRSRDGWCAAAPGTGSGP